MGGWINYLRRLLSTSDASAGVRYSLGHLPDGKFVDEVFVDPTAVRLTRLSPARFDLRCSLETDRELVVTLWTTKKGAITTRTEPEVLRSLPNVLDSDYLPDGRLKSLHLRKCGVHLEWMSRGHYWLGFDPRYYVTIPIDFYTPGYIKAVAKEEATPSLLGHPSTETSGVMKALPRETEELERVSKRDILALADGLTSGTEDVVEDCIRFICAETRGVWHGRGRAMMCRRLKHLLLPSAHRERLVNVILERLDSGNFSEQFRDQLRLAINLDSEKTFAVARRALSSPRDHVRRYSDWVLSHQFGQ